MPFKDSTHQVSRFHDTAYDFFVTTTVYRCRNHLTYQEIKDFDFPAISYHPNSPDCYLRLEAVAAPGCSPPAPSLAGYRRCPAWPFVSNHRAATGRRRPAPTTQMSTVRKACCRPVSANTARSALDWWAGRWTAAADRDWADRTTVAALYATQPTGWATATNSRSASSWSRFWCCSSAVCALWRSSDSRIGCRTPDSNGPPAAPTSRSRSAPENVQRFRLN